MQPDKTSAAKAVMIGNRNARATRTGAIPYRETAKVLHRLWLTNGFYAARDRERMGKHHEENRKPVFHAMRSDHAALTPAPIGHDTPVPPSPQ